MDVKYTVQVYQTAAKRYRLHRNNIILLTAVTKERFIIYVYAHIMFISLYIISTFPRVNKFLWQSKRFYYRFFHDPFTRIHFHQSITDRTLHTRWIILVRRDIVKRLDIRKKSYPFLNDFYNIIAWFIGYNYYCYTFYWNSRWSHDEKRRNKRSYNMTL